MKKRLLLAFLFCLFFRIGCAYEEFCGAEEFIRAHVGFCIIEVETEKEVCSLHGEQFFIPASLQKIPVSVVAISKLGREHRFKTTLEYDGHIDNEGVLYGNVWIHGGGDPTLQMDLFSEWSDEVQKKGISKIDGNIYLDVSDFETALASPYWEFQDLGNYYGAGASALTINQNLYRITFKPGMKEGDPAEVVQTEPEISHVVVHNEVTTGPAGSGDQVFVYGTEYSPIQFYRGTVPIDEPFLTIKASIPDPARFCASLLKRKICPSKGIEIFKDKIHNPPTKTLISRKESPTLKELIAVMNRDSVNLYAEHFLKAIGSGSSQRGASFIQEFLKNLRVPALVRDGSGLSRNNYLTPRGFTRLLCHIRKSPFYQFIYDSLPQPGEKGTLHSFPEIEGASMRAKTGSMSNIYNLGGYLTLDSGKEYAFCLFCNNYYVKSDGRRRVQEEMHRFLSHFVKNIMN